MTEAISSTVEEEDSDQTRQEGDPNIPESVASAKEVETGDDPNLTETEEADKEKPANATGEIKYETIAVTDEVMRGHACMAATCMKEIEAALKDPKGPELYVIYEGKRWKLIRGPDSKICFVSIDDDRYQRMAIKVLEGKRVLLHPDSLKKLAAHSGKSETALIRKRTQHKASNMISLASHLPEATRKKPTNVKDAISRYPQIEAALYDFEQAIKEGHTIPGLEGLIGKKTQILYLFRNNSAAGQALVRVFKILKRIGVYIGQSAFKPAGRQLIPCYAIHHDNHVLYRTLLHALLERILKITQCPEELREFAIKKMVKGHKLMLFDNNSVSIDLDLEKLDSACI